MAKEKKSVAKSVKEFYDRHDKLTKLLDNTEIVHSEAFHAGLGVLHGKDGKVDYAMLDDVKNQDKFLDKLMSHYISSAVKSMGLKSAPKDAMEEEIMLKRYVGVTRGELKKILRKAGSDYKLKDHENIRDQLIDQQKAELMPLRHGHMEKKDISDILKHVSADRYVSKDVGIERAASLLDHYRVSGEITPGTLSKLVNTEQKKGGWGDDAYLSKKGKEAVKGLKTQYKKAA